MLPGCWQDSHEIWFIRQMRGWSHPPPEEPLMWSWLCLRFLAKAMIKRAYHCSFGLSKTLKEVSSDELAFTGNLFIHLCISKMGSKNSIEKFWLIVRKHVSLQPILRKSIKIAVMQRQKFNTLGGLNIQSIWCLECDSYMHTSSIAAPRYSDRKTFHIARGGSGLLLT